MTTIETDRLRLRPWTEDDFEPFRAYYADERTARYVGGAKDVDEAWRHFALQIGHWELKGFGYWAVEEKDSGSFAGSVGLWKSAGWPELELGYWLLPEFQGRGYAREAATRARDYARDALGAPTLVSYIAPENEPSIRLAESLGATREESIELLTHGPHAVYRYF